MNKFIKYAVFVIFIFIIALVVSKPSEQEFLNRIARDYSNLHPDFQLSSADLVKVGSTQYRSQLIFSSYTYKFGSIEVSYLGILGSVYSNGYRNEVEYEEESTTIDI